jgi:hypothetical protein
LLLKEGFKVVDICKALNMAISSFYALINPKRDAQETYLKRTDEVYIVDKIKVIIAEHPFWGYRRVCAWLNHREHIKIKRRKYIVL